MSERISQEEFDRIKDSVAAQWGGLMELMDDEWSVGCMCPSCAGKTTYEQALAETIEFSNSDVAKARRKELREKPPAMTIYLDPPEE